MPKKSLSEERQDCADARDLWYSCLDAIPSILPHPACDEELQNLYAACSRESWRRRHVFRRLLMFTQKNPHYQVDVEVDLKDPYAMRQQVLRNEAEDASKNIGEKDKFDFNLEEEDEMQRKWTARG